MKKYILLLFIILAPAGIIAQTGDIKIGRDPSLVTRTQGGYYDYSDPEAVNIKVSVWGFVRYPGRYMIPSYSNVRDLISYAGGPTDDAHLDDLRLYRNNDSTQAMLKFDYNDLLWDPELNVSRKDPPEIQVGDILLVPGTPRLYFRDYFQMTLSIISVLISLTILVLNISRN